MVVVRRAGEIDEGERPFLDAMARRWLAKAPPWPGGSTAPGASNEDRARWLLDFAVMDLGNLSAGDWQKLCSELEAFLNPHGFPFITVRAQHLEPKQVRGLQRWLCEGLLMLNFSNVWQVPRNELILFHWARRSGLTHRTFRQDQIGAAREVFRPAVATLLSAVADRFRFCGECGRPFVARKSQAYCGPRCSQATRTRRFREKEC
jgi:hypothetical protein